MCYEPKDYHTAVVCGKFYPPHKGHHYLIDTACEYAKKVTVLLCWKSDETLPIDVRMKCLQEQHPTVTIIPVPCIPDDDDSTGWGKYTIEILGYTPDVVLSSEDYGEPYAKAMSCHHILVDKPRMVFPISGTEIRYNPLKYFNYLSPAMKAYYALRIVIVGAESTGTTTLANALSKHYETLCVPEYGRTYTEWKYEKYQNAGWHTGEFKHIAIEQNKLEDLYARNANRVLICDTDSFATGIWCKRYCGVCPSDIEAIGNDRNIYYILTGDEIPFIQDKKGTRDGESIRHNMHIEFHAKLNKYHKKYIRVKGTEKERLKSAITFIDNLIKETHKEPPVYCKHARFATTVVDDTTVIYNNYYCALGNIPDPKWCEHKTTSGPCQYREEK